MDATAERERVLNRLRGHYANRTPIFGDLARIAVDEGFPRYIAPPVSDCGLSLGQLQRLMRGVVAEYGEDDGTRTPLHR